MGISKVARHRLLCCVSTLYVYMSKVLLINVKSKHEERLIFDRLFVRVFFRLLKLSKILINLISLSPIFSFVMMLTVIFTSYFQ